MELMELGPAQRAGRWVILGFGLAFTLVPIAWVLSVAFRPSGTFTFPVGIVPTAVTFDNFGTVLFARRAEERTGRGLGEKRPHAATLKRCKQTCYVFPAT